jgi:hypothetical protein
VAVAQRGGLSGAVKLRPCGHAAELPGV